MFQQMKWGKVLQKRATHCHPNFQGQLVATRYNQSSIKRPSVKRFTLSNLIVPQSILTKILTSIKWIQSCELEAIWNHTGHHLSSNQR